MEVFTIGRGAYPHISEPHVYIRRNKGAGYAHNVVISFNRWDKILEPFYYVDYMIDDNRVYFDFSNFGNKLEFSFHVARFKVHNDKRLVDFISRDYYIPKYDKESGYWYIEK